MPAQATAPRTPAAAPRTPVAALSLLRAGRRQSWLLVTGLLAMVVCAGVFVLVYVGADARVPVLAAQRPLAAGQAITTGDLRVVRIVPAPGVGLVPAARVGQVVGRSVAVPVPEGGLLSEAHLGPPVWPAAGQAVAALPVKPGRLPAGVAAGSRVLVVVVASDPLAPPAGAPAGPEARPAAPVPATVMHVAQGVDGTGIAVVTLLLAHADAVRVAAAAGDLALVLAGAGS
jgi:hypothetical protein